MAKGFALAIMAGLAGFAAAASGIARADDGALTYQDDVKPILDDNCVECHHAGGRLSNFAEFPFTSRTTTDQATIVGNIIAKVTAASRRMPPGTRSPLSATQVQTLRDWLAGGLEP
jgi:hypothetical protein